MKIKEVLKRSQKQSKSRKRVGRGTGSGRGKTCGRGHKGQKSRAGKKQREGFEGGQMPLIRRIPKRGFSNLKSLQYQIVNIKQLSKFESGDTVNPEKLKKMGIVKKKSAPIKILGDGEIDKNIEVWAHRFSKKAKEKIKEAGGKVEIL